MFVFIFQFLDYQLGDENIILENNIATNSYNIPFNISKRNLLKMTDLLGREAKIQTNTPFIEIYDDGTVEKKIIIE